MQLHPATRWTLAAIFGVLFTAGSTRAVDAQVLRGSVRDSASGQPIPGAVLVLLDSAGHALGRNITNERGEYAAAVSPTIRRMQLLRIGFRPHEFAVPAYTGSDARLDAYMVTIPTLLQPISIVDQPACSKRDDRVAALTLWEQARAALLATVVAREANPPELVRLHFVRQVNASDSVVNQSVRIDSASTSRPFLAARSAAEFVDSGFVSDSAGTKMFSEPDADVMLDDAFVRGYCFQIAAGDRTRPREMGLGFSAAKSARGRVDIDGVLWIDTVSRTLSNLEFKYVGLGGQFDRFHPGGRVSFRTMENGMVLIDRWSIRTVGGGAVSPNGTFLQRLNNRTIQVSETGGEVAHARWQDGREWQASLGTFRGRVSSIGSDTTMVQLEDTDYRATIDSTGMFEISNLLPGPYRVGVLDRHLAALGLLLKTTSSFVAARDSIVTMSVNAPSVSSYVAARCAGSGHAVSQAVLIVRVVLPTGAPAAGALVQIRAVDERGFGVRLDGGNADENGLFQLCNAPRDKALQIQASNDGFSSVAATKEVRGDIETVRLRLAPPRP